MIYNTTKLDGELKAAGLPIVGCSSDGRIDWAEGHPTAEERAAAEAVLAAHDPTPEPEIDVDAELEAAIAAATTLEQLKSALMGKIKRAKVKGRSVWI